MSDQIWQMSRTKPNFDRTCLSKEILLHDVERETPLFGKEILISFRNLVDWIEHV